MVPIMVPIVFRMVPGHRTTQAVQQLRQQGLIAESGPCASGCGETLGVIGFEEPVDLAGRNERPTSHMDSAHGSTLDQSIQRRTREAEEFARLFD